MSSQVSGHFPEAMNVVTLKNEMEKIKERLGDFKEEAVMLVGEHGTGKTWIAGEIVDAAVRDELFSGGLWFYLHKKYDEETFMLEVAYQLSLLSTRRVDSDSKPKEKNGDKKVEEEERKKEQELFWASEVPGYEDEQEKEEEDERSEQKDGNKKNDEKPTFQGSTDIGVTDPATKDGEKGEDDKSKKEKDAKTKRQEKLQEEEKEKKKKEEEEDRVKKLKLKISALLSNKKYLLVLDGYRPRSKIEGGEPTEEEINSQLNDCYKEIMSRLEMYVRETKIQFPKILITVSNKRVDESESLGHPEIQAADNGVNSSARSDKNGNSQVARSEADGKDIKSEQPENGAKEGAKLNLRDGGGDLSNKEERKGSAISDKRNARLLKWAENLEFDKVRKVKIMKLSRADCSSFFKEKSELASNPRAEELSEAIYCRSKGLPAAVLLVAKALKHIDEKERFAKEGKIPKEGRGEWSLDRAIDRVINFHADEDPVPKKADEGPVSNKADDDAVPKKADESPIPKEVDEDPASKEANKSLFRCGYDMLPSTEHANCCWYSRKLFKERDGAIHYNELISYWIMEGFLGPTDCVKKSYNKAFEILTDLLKLGMFVWREDNLVTMETQALKVTDDRGHNISVTSSLGLVGLFGKDPMYYLGRMALAEGVLKTPCHDKALHMVTTLLMDQNRLCRDVPQDLFRRMQDLQTLVLLSPILEKLPPSLYQLKKLHILVLRGCEQLKNVEGISNVQTLKVLEISGAGSLDEIPDDFFEKMTQLICLNLSGSGITSVPSPSENSKDARPTLRWLILRGCPKLEELPSMSNFEKLEVLDLSGSASFGKIKDNFFLSLPHLQTVNLSGTKIQAFPIVGSLPDLSRLLFKDCKKLKRIPRFPVHITHLDLSGCSDLLEFRDETLVEKEKLKTIKASQTSIVALPTIPMPPKLAHLGLDHVINVKDLTPKTAVPTLELLDVSAAREPAEIEADLFGKLERIQILNLSGTRVTSLRSLPNNKSLHQLILSGCGDLTELPVIDGLTGLEVLDLSQCALLGDKELHGLDKLSRLRELNLSGAWSSREFDASAILGQMTSLQKLDLSENLHLEELRNMSELKSLSELSLKNCKLYKELESVKENDNLQVLDLSGTSVTSVPAMHSNSKSKLRRLDLSGTEVKQFPYQEIRELKKLECLKLPKMENIEWSKISDSGALRLPEELAFDGHGIFELANAQGGSTGQTPAVDSKLPEEPTSKVANAQGGRISQIPAGGSKLPEEPTSKVANAQGDSTVQIPTGGFKLPEEPTSEVADNQGGSTVQTSEGGSKFAVGSIKQHSEEELLNCYDKTLISVLQTLKYSLAKQAHHQIEAHGIDAFPDACRSFLKRSEYLSVVDTSSKSLSHLGRGIMNDIKGCWLDRCPNMESVITVGSTEEVIPDDIVAEEKLEVLWLSNLPLLKTMYSEEGMYKCFQNLKILYLDCCPKLTHVFSLSHVPEKLEDLEIRFCDKLTTLFKDNKSGNSNLKLKKLRLFMLPELESIGAEMPCLAQKPDITECPKLPAIKWPLN